MKNLIEIGLELSQKLSTLDEEILSSLKFYKKDAIGQNDQELAKRIWCMEQVYKIKSHYLKAFSMLKNKEFSSAWGALDRADIELYFLLRHYDIANNDYQLSYISKTIKYLQKLFPYRSFYSREAIVTKKSCTICNQIVRIRNGCGHVVGDIYSGEMCGRKVEEFEILGFSLVENPFDKYTVTYVQGKEYNYKILENLMEHFNDPYERWEIVMKKELNPKYVNIKGFQLCPCDSGKKFKKCCMLSGDYAFDHLHIEFLDKSIPFETPMEIVGTWKED